MLSKGEEAQADQSNQQTEQNNSSQTKNEQNNASTNQNSSSNSNTSSNDNSSSNTSDSSNSDSGSSNQTSTRTFTVKIPDTADDSVDVEIVANGKTVHKQFTQRTKALYRLKLQALELRKFRLI